MLDNAFPHLTKAPIAEAVIEIRAAFAEPVREELYDTFRDIVQVSYPSHLAMRSIEPHFHFLSDTEVSTKTAFSRIGVQLWSADKKTVVIAKSDGLVVSRLPPYKSWSSLLADIQPLWRSYFEIFSPSLVTRLGVRYINRIALDYSDGRLDFDTIFVSGPQIPRGLPQVVENFSTRVVIPIESHGATLAIVQALEVPAVPPHFAILDVDAFMAVRLVPEETEIWRQLGRLREVKNMAFFESLQKPIWEKYL
jgi:uncharacterized protein (TIGR04255 family)